APGARSAGSEREGAVTGPRADSVDGPGVTVRDTPESGGAAEAGAGAVTAAAPKPEEEPVVEYPPLRKRDLLRRKFDEEISEPWVQCDRCNSWVHQVCALFNARSNVGESTFVCPLCRLGDSSVGRAKPRDTTLTPTESHYSARKRPKPDPCPENGHATPPQASATAEDQKGLLGAARLIEGGETKSTA
ncbi:unnamed protein product, partial [Sphacelaria rigidula]